MQTAASVHYLYDKSTGMELIACDGSELSYPLHNHVSVFTVGLVLRGAIVFTAGNVSRICEKDACFAVPPYLPHQMEAVQPYTLLTLCVPKTGRKDALSVQAGRLLAASDMVLTQTQTARLLDTLAHLDEAAPLRTAAPWVEQARAQLESCPEENVRIAEMARAFYVSPYHFIRSFKQAVGLTPHQFQVQNRVRKAQRFLQEQISSTQAALAAGFCDQSHFIRQFERQVGLTPTAYKNACRALPGPAKGRCPLDSCKPLKRLERNF